MALARCSYAVGRESRQQYGESLAGHTYNHVMKFQDWDGSLLPGMHYDPQEVSGQGDNEIMAYTFCSILTRAANRIPFEAPTGYRPENYTVTAMCIERDRLTKLSDLVQPLYLEHASKYIILSTAGVKTYMSSDMTGASWRYPDGSTAERQHIHECHKRYVQGLLYFLATDSIVPASIRQEVGAYGLAVDEFIDNGGWPWQMYVREGRRLIGQYVMTQADVTTAPTKADSIGLNNWPIDCHPCDLYADATPQMVLDGWMYQKCVTYQLPYSAMLPREVSNLAVSVCLSASHVAWCSLRVEPGLMALGEAAGTAAAMAVQQGMDLSAVNVSELQADLTANGGVRG